MGQLVASRFFGASGDSMHEVELLLLLMVAVAGLSVLARPLGVPYPILLEI
jgi:hypothetical protein